jgi:putative transposase
MKSAMPANPDKHHRCSAEMISHAVWLYGRFCLSSRDVEEHLVARGVIVTYEAIRQWCRKFGQAYAHQPRRRRPRPGDTWPLEAVFLTIQDARHSLWRAVDQAGTVLAMLGQRRRDNTAAKQCFRKRLKGCRYGPRGAHHGPAQKLRGCQAGKRPRRGAPTAPVSP